MFEGLIWLQPPSEIILPEESSTIHTESGPQNWLKLTPTPICDMVADTLTPDTTHKQPSPPEGPPHPEHKVLKLIPPGTSLSVTFIVTLSMTQMVCGQVMIKPVSLLAF